MKSASPTRTYVLSPYCSADTPTLPLSPPRIDPLAWLIRHIPETVVFELDEDGNPIKGSDVLKPKDLAAAQAAAAAAAGAAGMVVVEDEEAKLKREEEARRLAERQKCARFSSSPVFSCLPASFAKECKTLFRYGIPIPRSQATKRGLASRTNCYASRVRRIRKVGQERVRLGRMVVRAVREWNKMVCPHHV